MISSYCILSPLSFGQKNKTDIYRVDIKSSIGGNQVATKPEIFALPGTGSIRFALTLPGAYLTLFFSYVRS
jgi:hypothetical protein